MKCIAFTSCRPATPPPASTPTSTSPSFPPSHPPPTPIPRITFSPVTETPVQLVQLTLPPTESLTESYNTEEVYTTKSEPTGKPTEDYNEETIYTEQPKAEPVTSQPTSKPIPNPTPPQLPPSPTLPTSPPQVALPSSKVASIPAPSQELIAAIGSILVSASSGISNDVLVKIDLMTMQASPSKMYQYSGFINALGVISKGDMGSSFFYLGDNPNEPNYGLANVALFLSQAAIESVQWDVCDDISWEKDVFGRYPLANSCGQGRFTGQSMVSYEESNQCAEDEAFMACDVDLDMSAVATTHGIFAGAPPPLECHPSTTTEKFTGAWDPTLSCVEDGCNDYYGQTIGGVDPQSVPTANSVSIEFVYDVLHLYLLSVFSYQYCCRLFFKHHLLVWQGKTFVTSSCLLLYNMYAQSLTVTCRMQ